MLTPEERDLLEVSTALFGFGTQADALEATTKAVEQIAREHVSTALHEAALLIEQTPTEQWREPLIAGSSPEQGLYNGANAAIRFTTRVLREKASDD